nr:YitT family protein [Paenibacillus turpanensis]
MEYGLLLAGSFIVAISFNLFLFPNKIASGGVSGISILVQELLGVEPAYTQWLLNIPLFIAGVMLLGKRFGIRTLVGSVVLPLFVWLTRGVEPWTTDVLLAALYGGIGVGLGLGIVFRGRGSTGGLDLAAQIIHRYTGIGLGLSIALLDGLVIITAGLIFSPERALVALIGLYVTSKTIDIVQLGFGTSKVAYIISEQVDRVSSTILHDLDRGLTKLTGLGGYTEKERIVLMVVVSQNEVSRLKALVREADPKAFVVLTDASEVLGEGFKLEPGK